MSFTAFYILSTILSLIMTYMTWQNERMYNETMLTWGLFFLLLACCFVPIINASILVCLAACWRTGEDAFMMKNTLDFLQRKVNK